MCARAWVGSTRRGLASVPQDLRRFIPQANPTRGLSPDPKGPEAFPSPLVPAHLACLVPDLSFSIVRGWTGWTRNSVKCTLCVDARSPGGCELHSHPPVQGPMPTHLAIYHHPQPRQLIASPRARPRARRGRSPRPARGAAGRPAAELMARPPVPARPGAPRPSPMPLPLSAPRLAALLAVGASLLGSAGAAGARDGWAETARPRPGPAQLARRCEGRAPVRELGDALGLFPRRAQATGPRMSAWCPRPGART